MSRIWVETSGESQALAFAEVGAAAEALGGRPVGPVGGSGTLYEVELPRPAADQLASRLALAHRCLVEPVLSSEGILVPAEAGTSAVFRPLGRPTGGGIDEAVLAAGRRWKAGGGTVDLTHPDRRFWKVAGEGDAAVWMEELAPVDRRSVAGRRLSKLPFRRPVGLDPRLARATANLARPRSGARLVDPFVGTGALLAEAALLGARVVGIDRDPTMVQGALRNFAHLGLVAEAMVVGDAGTVDGPELAGPFDAVLSDLPYGRSAGTGGEDAVGVIRRVLPRWAERVRPGGRVVVVTPGGEDPLEPPWRRRLSVPVRVHRSLTREFRVYERDV